LLKVTLKFTPCQECVNHWTDESVPALLNTHGAENMFNARKHHFSNPYCQAVQVYISKRKPAKAGKN
jgi:hypothetical protein